MRGLKKRLSGIRNVIGKKILLILLAMLILISLLSFTAIFGYIGGEAAQPTTLTSGEVGLYVIPRSSHNSGQVILEVKRGQLNEA